MILQYPTRCSECKGYMKAGDEADWLGAPGDYTHPDAKCPDRPVKRQNQPGKGNDLYWMARCCTETYGVPKGIVFTCPSCGRTERQG